MQPRRVVVLGASGLVGQRLQQRLANHPWFELAAVVGGPESATQRLSEIPCRLDEGRPLLPDINVLSSKDHNLSEKLVEMGVSIAFSGLPSDVALKLEMDLAENGLAVFSNSSAYRRHDGIPLVVAEVNPEHLDHFAIDGLPIACATNCTLIPMIMPLAAIHRHNPLKAVKMRSEQALSGAGWRLLNDEKALAGQVDPHIEGEAYKTAAELRYCLGEMIEGPRAKKPKSDVHIRQLDIATDVECARVARRDGHHVFVEAEFENSISEFELRMVLNSFISLPQMLNLPSAPNKPIQLVEQIDVNSHLWADGDNFPQNPDPSKDLRAGMATVVGNVRLLDTNKISLEGYSHNTIRGAAGGVVLLAELALAQGHLD